MQSTDLRQVDIRLLGPVSVAVDGRDVAIGSPKQRIVLAMLALSGRVSSDALAGELWRETPPASVAATIHTLVSRLRRTLEAAGGEVAIHADAGGYVLDIDPGHLDVSCFQELAAAGRCAQAESSPAQAARCFHEALSLWRGAALADLADREFARVAAVRLDGARLDVAEELADAELAAGRPAAALEAVEPLIPEHPFRERLRGLQMLALYRLARQAEALAAYQDLRRTLADELGLDPTHALQTLEGQILRQSPELDGPATGPIDNGAAEVRPPPAGPLSGGTLAFLFTDIEASTRRWEGDRAAMAADLAHHDAVLREVVALHHGQSFTHTGDGLGAAFSAASSALAAAVAAQRALARVSWHGATPLRVRMAIHAGTAEARAGTFLGPTLNRAARLLDEARGGQILCSQAAADLACDELPDGMTLVEMGERRLEGLSRPERIWQVLHPDVPELTAPPPVTARRSGALTSFVGRENELAELTTSLTGARLVTITGLGGAGKTRLALELAARMEKHYGDGASIVELVPVRDDRVLAHEVLSALGVLSDTSSGLDATEQLCQVLAHRHLLLVLDNCEHLLEPVAILVGAVLRRCPQVTILATSRQVLSLPGEWAWAAPGLSLPPPDADVPDDLDGSDAAELFSVRARTAQPGFGVTATNAAAVARICRRLDGIPLALELAAARVRVLGVTQLAERLDDRFRLLTAGPRGAPARHQTLRAAMDWSFELLPDPEQRLLRQLSIFPQSFDLEAATAVAGNGADELDVLDLLARLVDKSLVVPEGAADTARYRLLETVRQYAAEKLAGTEEEGTRSRHRRHFADRITSAYRSGVSFYGLDWARQVTRDDENYNTALAAAVSDGDLEGVTVLVAGRGYPWYWGNSIPAVLESVDPDALICSEPSLHIEALLSLAASGVTTGRWGVDTVVPVYEQALAIADGTGTRADRGFICYFLGYMARGRGDSVTARSWMEEALSCFGDVPSVIGRFYTHSELGWIDMTEGNATAARRHFRSGLELFETSSGFDIQEIHLRAGLALAETSIGNAAEGLALARQAVGEARSIALRAVLVMALVRAAEATAVAGEPTGPELAEVLRLLRDQHTLRWVAAALTVAAVAHEARGRLDVAARLLGGAAGVAQTLGEDPLPIPALAAVVARSRERLAEALDSDTVAGHDAAGRRMPVPQLLQLALDDLGG